MKMSGMSSETGQSFDINKEPNDEEGLGSKTVAKGDEVDDSKRDAETGSGDQNMEDDPFELGPIIDEAMKESK